MGQKSSLHVSKTTEELPRFQNSVEMHIELCHVTEAYF